MKQIWYMGDDSHQTSWICFLMFLNDVTFGMRLHYKRKHVHTINVGNKWNAGSTVPMSELNALYTFGNVFIDNGFVYTTLQLLKTSSRLIWNEKKRWLCLITYHVNDTNAIVKKLHAIFFRKLRKYARFFIPSNSKEVYLWACDRNAIFLSTELISYNFHDVSKTAAE